MTGTAAQESPDADALVVAGHAAPSQRTRLERGLIIDTAVMLVDASGIGELSMRRLGAELDVEAMALYRYVSGREDLLDGVVARVLAELYDDPEVHATPQDGWQDFVVRIAHGVRRIALAHPGVFPLVASRPAEAPWIRPPLRSLTAVERFLDGLCSEGFSDEAAVAAYRAFTSFLLGHLLLEVAGLGVDVTPLDVLEQPAEHENSDLGPYPHVRRLSDRLAKNESVAEFETALEQLVDRLTLTRTITD